MFNDGCYCKGSNHMNLALKSVSYVYESSSELAQWLSGFAPSVAV